jgi:hypothetical protein
VRPLDLESERNNSRGSKHNKLTNLLEAQNFILFLQDSGDFDVVVIMESNLKHNVANDSAP